MVKSKHNKKLDDIQTYKNIISNLTNGLSCKDCHYLKICPSKEMDEIVYINVPCSELMFMAERRLEKNGKN